jgi:hypothetical protein
MDAFRSASLDQVQFSDETRKYRRRCEHVDATIITHPMLIEVDERMFIGRKGDYLITFPNGFQKFMSPQEFEAMYEQVDYTTGLGDK